MHSTNVDVLFYFFRYMETITSFPDYWSNNFKDLSCLYLGADVDESPAIWGNSTGIVAYETNLLSQVCLNGSFSNLNYTEWNERCFPSYTANVGLRRAAGVWALFNFLVGTLGNLLTLVAIPYARAKCR